MADTPVTRKKAVTNVSDLSYDTDLAIRLCLFKARPKTALALLRGIVTRFSINDVRRMYKDVTGESAPKGQLPFSAIRIISASERRLHASHIAIKLRTYEQGGFDLNNAELHLRLYENYLHDFDLSVANAVLTFEHLYAIIRDIRIGDLAVVKCTDCKLHFVNVCGCPVSMHACPVCNLLKSREAIRMANELPKRKESPAASTQ